MMTNKTRAKLERDLESLQAIFTEKLLRLLKVCAAGQWGLFGRNGDQWDNGGELVSLGEDIFKLRKRLGYSETFELYERFAAYRARRDPNDPGEPKLAQVLLAEIDDQS